VPKYVGDLIAHEPTERVTTTCSALCCRVQILSSALHPKHCETPLRTRQPDGPNLKEL